MAKKEELKVIIEPVGTDEKEKWVDFVDHVLRFKSFKEWDKENNNEESQKHGRD